MQLPGKGSAYPHRIAFSVYVERRLRREGLNELADQLTSARAALLGIGRAWEDAAIPVQECMADRDSADDGLDALAIQLRFQLGARDINAKETAPFTQIFPEAIKYYTSANLDEQVARYSELKTRLLTYLPANDPLLTQVPVLETLLNTWSNAVAALELARTQETMAREQLESITQDWQTLLEKIYGTLISSYGKKGAEVFFP